jgi:hypothetical protein
VTDNASYARLRWRHDETITKSRRANISEVIPSVPHLRPASPCPASPCPASPIPANQHLAAQDWADLWAIPLYEASNQ